ncbi:MAG: carboxymuconolactone decarboxylase family protein [Candidatus Bipolaricaulia bacterium]
MATAQKTMWFEKHAPEMAAKWDAFGDAINEGELDAKTRELITVAATTVLRCNHCTKAHIHRAKQADADEEEISEALMVASLISSGTQLFWMTEDYEKLLGQNGDAPWFAEQTDSMGNEWLKFHDKVYEDSALDRKTKELIATAVATLERCTHCTKGHIQGSLEHGASKAEVSEAIMVASFFAATTQLMWMIEDYEQLLG